MGVIEQLRGQVDEQTKTGLARIDNWCIQRAENNLSKLIRKDLEEDDGDQDDEDDDEDDGEYGDEYGDGLYWALLDKQMQNCACEIGLYRIQSLTAISQHFTFLNVSVHVVGAMREVLDWFWWQMIGKCVSWARMELLFWKRHLLQHRTSKYEAKHDWIWFSPHTHLHYNLKRKWDQNKKIWPHSRLWEA